MMVAMLLVLPCRWVSGQEATSAEARPLPELRALMQAVIDNERSAEAARKDYIFTMTVTMDRLQKDGALKEGVG